jgi:hypothetical protein
MSSVPWFLPGVLVSIAASVALAIPLGRALAVRPTIAGALVFSLGIVLSATLTPLRGAIEAGAAGTGTCDFSRLGLAPIAEAISVNDTSLNILLFVPLGVVVGYMPRTRCTAGIVIASITLPFLIEAVQLVASDLARGCQSADVIDNLTGLFVGAALGSTSRLLLREPAD